MLWLKTEEMAYIALQEKRPDINRIIIDSSDPYCLENWSFNKAPILNTQKGSI